MLETGISCGNVPVTGKGCEGVVFVSIGLLSDVSPELLLGLLISSYAALGNVSITSRGRG